MLTGDRIGNGFRMRRDKMAKLVFGAALLFAFVNVSVPVYAQSVYLHVCNAGKVDIDVFVSRAGNVSSSHVGSAGVRTATRSRRSRNGPAAR